MPDKRFFYVNPSKVEGDRFTLDETESHHLSHVLRINEHDSIWLLDGDGIGYEARIESVGKSVSGSIVNTHVHYGEPDVSVHLAFGIIKRDRLELLLEKGTEVGVKSFSPLVLDRCVKKSINVERCEKIIQSASKQYGRSVFPSVCKPVTLDHWVHQFAQDSKAVLHWEGERTISEFSGESVKGPTHFLIGPEGDFSENEMAIIRNSEIECISLGNRRLRSETAAITAVSFRINFENVNTGG